MTDTTTLNNDSDYSDDETNNQNKEKEEPAKKTSNKLSKAVIDSCFQSNSKSTSVLFTKSKLILDDEVLKVEEEIRINLKKDSSYILDNKSGLYYKNENDCLNKIKFSTKATVFEYIEYE